MLASAFSLFLLSPGHSISHWNAFQMHFARLGEIRVFSPNILSGKKRFFFVFDVSSTFFLEVLRNFSIIACLRYISLICLGVREHQLLSVRLPDLHRITYKSNQFVSILSANCFNSRQHNLVLLEFDFVCRYRLLLASIPARTPKGLTHI